MAVRLRRRGRLPATPNLRSLRDAESFPVAEQPTIDEIVKQYLDWKSSGASKNTIGAYTTGLRLFSRWLTGGGIDPSTDAADALPRSVMDEYIAWMRKRPSLRTGMPISARSVALYHAAVVDLFKYAARRGWLPSRINWVEMKANATETLGKIPTQSAQFDPHIPELVAYVDQLPLPQEHRRHGRAQLELLRDRALMHLLVSSGMSKSEVVALDRTHIEDAWNDSTVIIGRGRNIGKRHARQRRADFACSAVARPFVSDCHAQCLSGLRSDLRRPIFASGI
jgi:site-specific recombinase XerD